MLLACKVWLPANLRVSIAHCQVWGYRIRLNGWHQKYTHNLHHHGMHAYRPALLVELSNVLWFMHAIYHTTQSYSESLQLELAHICYITSLFTSQHLKLLSPSNDRCGKLPAVFIGVAHAQGMKEAYQLYIRMLEENLKDKQ